MASDVAEAQRRIRELHAEEAREKKLALTFPDGPERDEHWMRAERLSDEAWHIEETLDLGPASSGLRH